MSRNIGRLFDPWRFVPIGDDQEKLPASINRNMASLERLIESMRLAMTYGPVGGAYLPFFFRATKGFAKLTAGLEYSGIVLPADCRPIAASAWCDDPAGQITLQLVCSTSGNVFTGDWQFTNFALLNQRADFALDVLPAEEVIDLDVISVDAGTPLALDVVLWTKNVSKIEPA